MMKDVVIPLAVVGLTGIVGLFVFLVQRRLSGARALERVQLYNQAGDFLSKLRQHGLSVEEVEQARRFFDGSSPTLRDNAALLAVVGGGAEGVGTAGDGNIDYPDGYWTTSSMSLRSAAAFGTADARLNEVLAELRTIVDAKGSVALDAMQEAWSRYRDLRARYASLVFDGGTLQTIMWDAEATAVTEERIADLRQDLVARLGRRY